MAAYSNPALPPKTMMKIYKAATPDGGSELNVLKFSQASQYKSVSKWVSQYKSHAATSRLLYTY